jgi:hypothetical protein
MNTITSVKSHDGRDKEYCLADVHMLQLLGICFNQITLLPHGKNLLKLITPPATAAEAEINARNQRPLPKNTVA